MVSDLIEIIADHIDKRPVHHDRAADAPVLDEQPRYRKVANAPVACLVEGIVDVGKIRAREHGIREDERGLDGADLALKSLHRLQCDVELVLEPDIVLVAEHVVGRVTLGAALLRGTLERRKEVGRRAHV